MSEKPSTSSMPFIGITHIIIPDTNFLGDSAEGKAMGEYSVEEWCRNCPVEYFYWFLARSSLS